MKKLIFILLFLCGLTEIFAQSNPFKIFYNKIPLTSNSETLQRVEAASFAFMELNIESQTSIYIEDIEFYIENQSQKFGEQLKLIEINPTTNKIWKHYQLRFTCDNSKEVANIHFSIKNVTQKEVLKVQFYKKNQNADVAMFWKSPLQPNRGDKTGIETIFDSYLIHIEVKSFEPILPSDFKVLLNDTFQKDKVTDVAIKAKAIMEENDRTVYVYDYTCKVKLYEGINTIKLEVLRSNYVPHQTVFYSNILYINKVKE